MYQIISKDFCGYTDDIVYIKIHPENGCYIICNKDEATGFCVKIPKEIETEEGKIITSEDQVFSFEGKEMPGVEEGKFIHTRIAQDYFKIQQSEKEMKKKLSEYEEELSILDSTILDMKYNLLVGE